jgi:hypothetical protein
MDMVKSWTGSTACALQAALRMSNEAFASHLDVGVRTVAAWHQKPARRPMPEQQQLLDTALELAPRSVKQRFAVLTSQAQHSEDQEREDAVSADTEDRLIGDLNINGALSHLDRMAGWEPGTARRAVSSRLQGMDRRYLDDRANRRKRVSRQRTADALGEYYQATVPDEHGLYRANCESDREIKTSVLTHPAWLDISCDLTADDRLTLSEATPHTDRFLDSESANAAVQRIAEVLASGTRFVDAPLYRLVDADVRPGQIAGRLAITRFAQYALTLDLLEGELADALTAGMPPLPGLLPLRDRYLPDVASVLNTGDRTCAGGALALCAFARPPSPYRSRADYVLLIQERSGSVVNAPGQIAVIPKGFHQPMTDFLNDSRIAATLLREMEEELFGREDIDNTFAGQTRVADPMHPSRLTEPLRWLTENPDALRMECTAFGLNLISGNFEFACLIVVESVDFWHRFGGRVGANWESSGLRQYSSLDSASLSSLACDESWGNEGVFAFLQGLRRLKQIGGDRVKIPEINWKVEL